MASSRPYQVGDDVSSIDWRASARLSSARGADEFIVREHYAEEAPRAVVLCDRRPSMSLYPPELPWLRKPLAVQTAADAIVTSALAAQGNAGYLDYAGVDSLDMEPFWLPPRGSRSAWQIDERLAAEVAFDAPEESLSWAFDYLARFRGRVSFGTFIFVISDFLAPPPREAWLRSLALGWDVVPVIVQDPLWEQSFPELANLTLPLADPATGHVAGIRLSGAEVRRLKAANERRRDELVSELDALGLDWVLLSTHEATAVEWAFVEWAGARRARRVRSV